MIESNPELVVLLDEDGVQIGEAEKATVHGADTPLHLAFSCYITDASGRLLMTRRALDKKAWPGVWTNSCCGHPAPGEDAEAAVHRRVRQELSLELTELRLILPEFRYRAVDASGIVENEVCPVYWARAAQALAPNPSEIADWVWVQWPTVVGLAETAPWALSPWAAQQIPLLNRCFEAAADTPRHDRE